MKFFIENTKLVILIVISIIILGIRGVLSFQREAIPQVDFARGVISTVYPGSSSMEVEELITNKIEDEIRSIEGLKDTISTSTNGFSQIFIRVDIDNSNSSEVVDEIYRGLQDSLGELPKDVLDPPRLDYVRANEDPILSLVLVGPNKGRTRDEYAFQLKTLIEKIPGVSEVDLFHYRKREFQILLSIEKMKQEHISLADVAMAIRKQALDIPAGYLESQTNRHLVRILGKSRTPEDLEKIVVRSNFSGKKILIQDIGQVIDGAEKSLSNQFFFENLNDNENYNLQASTQIDIKKNLNTDTISLVERVNDALDSFKKTIDPDYKIFTLESSGERTKRQLSAVINNALTGLILVLIIFFLFLPLRTGLLSALSLPLTVLGTCSLLPFFGVTFNTITMLAFVICIGMLVDNSVVISEYCSRLLNQGKLHPKQVALQTVQKFWKPITATVLTTIVAFLPMIVTTGVMGQFIFWIPIVVTVALFMSLAESFFLLPNRLLWISNIRNFLWQKRVLSFLDSLEEQFERIVDICTKKKGLTITGILALFIACIVINKYGNRLDLFETRSPEFYTGYFEPKPNTVLKRVDEIAKILSKKMYLAIGPENVRRVAVNTSPKDGRIIIVVKPNKLKKLNHKTVLAKVREIEFPDLEKMRFNYITPGPPVGKPLQAVIQSNNLNTIKEFTEKVFPKIQKIPGLINLEIDPKQNVGEEFQVILDRTKLSRLGLDVQAVGFSLRTALEGDLITELTEDGESFYIRAKHDDRELSRLQNLQEIMIREPFGRLIPLNQIAHIKKVQAPPDRKHYNFQPALIIQGDVNEKITTSFRVNKEVKRIIEGEKASFPTISYHLIGQQETTKESLQSLFSALILALFGIFVILIVLLKSFSLSILILSTIPLGLIGVILSAFLHGRALSFFVFLGVVGLAGVVVNSAIILVNFILQSRAENPDRDIREIVVTSTKLRLRPIIITNLTTLGGLLPTAYGIFGYEPLLMPMTLALFWGLISATFLTLFWIPCCFLLIEEIGESLRNRWRGWASKST